MKKRIEGAMQFLSQPPVASWLIFALGLGVFLYFQVGLVSGPYRYRALPVESDDAYSYIVKSAVLMKSPSYDCPALKDLRPLFTPAPDDPQPLATEKWSRSIRLYTNYHPLYSLGLWALVKVEGISYEDAYRQLSVLGSLGLAMALSFFLVSLVGPFAAGISLACLAPLVFPGQDIVIPGIYSVVPSTLSLGIGLLMFGYLARREGRPGPTFYGLNLLAMGLHPVGIIYSGLAVAFGMVCRYPQGHLRSLKGFAPSLVLMAFGWGFYHLLPPFTMLPVPISPGVSYIGEVLGNLKKLTFYLKGFLLENGWPQGLFFLSKAPWWQIIVTQVIGFCLGIVSLRLRPGYGRDATFLAALLLLAPAIFTVGAAIMLLLILFRGLLDSEPKDLRLPLLALSILSVGMVISCLYILYPYSDTILDRAYIFWALGAAAVWGRGLMLMTTAPGLGQVLHRYVHAPLVNRVPSNPWFWRALLLVFVVFCFLPQQASDYKFRSNEMHWSIERYDMAMDVTQPRRVLQQTSPGDVILYGQDDTEVIVPFFLTHGCLERRAVYLPYLPLPPGLVFDPARVKFLVGTNPFLCLSQPRPPISLSQPQRDYYQLISLKNYLALPPGATLTLQLDSAIQPEAVEVLNDPGNLSSPGQHLLLTRQITGQTWTQDLFLPAGVWTTFPLAPHSGGTLSLSNPDKKLTVALAGLRLQPGSNPEWQWPWEGVKEVTWQNPSASQSQRFSPARKIAFQGRTYRMTVLQDGGVSVVWELMLMSPD